MGWFDTSLKNSHAYINPQPPPETKPKLNNVPGELRNAICEVSAIPVTEPETIKATTVIVSYSTITGYWDEVQLFYIDHISDSGRSTLLGKEIVQVTELTQEVLTLVMPKILFRTKTPQALNAFAEIFNARSLVCHQLPELHLEVDLFGNLDDEKLSILSRQNETKRPHGDSINIHDHVKEWSASICALPPNTTLHLVFSQIWMEFQSLRGLSKNCGIPKYQTSFKFTEPGTQDRDFFRAQTMAAVLDLIVSDMVGISPEKRAALVETGCRGFNIPRQYTNAPE